MIGEKNEISAKKTKKEIYLKNKHIVTILNFAIAHINFFT